MKKYTEEEKRIIGKYIIKLLKLKTHYAYAKDEENIRVDTTWGTKSYLGLYETLYRIMVEADIETIQKWQNTAP